MSSKTQDLDWRLRAGSLIWRAGALIDGAPVDPIRSGRIISPIDGRALYDVGLCGAVEVELAVAAARRSFDAGVWSGQSPQARGRVLIRLSELIEEHYEELALRDTLEMGKPITDSLLYVRAFAAAVCRYYAESADKVYGSAPGSDQGTLAYTLREPYGVVAAIAPWNFPLCNAVIKTVPALAMGNCVVLKPSELSPGSALRLAELALEAGVPPGVFNVIPGLGGDAGAALVSHGDVDLVTFTGSTATGQRIMQLAPAQRPKPVMLECGGKSPQIVFADAPTPDLSAPTIAAEAFANQGQVCVARSRLLVHVSRKDALIAELERVVADYVIGDPLDAATTFGPLASQQQRDRVVGMMDQAIRDGARPLLGGRDDDGCFVRPAIFDQVTPEMEAVRQEIFGPVLTVQTFETPEQALEMANATPYGLGATVWTRDYPTAHMMIRGLRAGHVTICATATAFEGPGFALASEPRGASGFGPETGLDGLRSYTALKSVVLQAG